jgi:hypothetical protein
MNQETVKTTARTAYYVSLGVCSWLGERTTTTIDHLRKEGEELDKNLNTRLESQRKKLQEWQEKIKTNVQEEWNTLSTREGWNQRIEQFNGTVKEWREKVEKMVRRRDEDEAETTATTEEGTKEEQEVVH